MLYYAITQKWLHEVTTFVLLTDGDGGVENDTNCLTDQILADLSVDR